MSAQPSKSEARKSDTEEIATSLAETVREKIESMILVGDLVAGERLNENTLAKKLNVSRGPVREASRLLAEAGLLTVIHNRGVFVREIKLEEVLHVYDVRAGLARVAGRLAALRASNEQIEDLRTLLLKMDAIIADQDFERYYEVNRKFHSGIVEISRNPRLIEFHENTEREVFLFLRRGAVSRPRISNEQHREIFDAIASGDEERAARAFEVHVFSGKQRMLESLV